MPVPKSAWFHTQPKRRRYLVGVSGGADSVALLHLLKHHGFRDIVVCHLDHGLRGRSSKADARFVAKLAASLGYPCETGHADVRERMRESGDSLETAARDARHGFFAQCSRVHRCPRLLLAHHADDQAETVLWNLLRGSRGLSGIRERQIIQAAGRPLECLRPLLALRRDQLRDWLAAEGHPWREDATNAKPIAVRNRLRIEALPLLSDIARRDATESLVRAAEASAELRAIECWAVKQAAVFDPRGRIHLPKLRTLPAELQAACLHELLRTAGIGSLSRDVIRRGLALMDPDAPASLTLPGGHILRRKEGRMFVA